MGAVLQQHLKGHRILTPWHTLCSVKALIYLLAMGRRLWRISVPLLPALANGHGIAQQPELSAFVPQRIAIFIPLGVSLGSITGRASHDELPATESSWSGTQRTKTQLSSTACLYIFALTWSKVSLIALNVEVVVEMGQMSWVCPHFPSSQILPITQQQTDATVTHTHVCLW